MRLFKRRGAMVAASAVGVAAMTFAASPAWADLQTVPGQTWGTNGTVRAMVTVGTVTVLGGDFTAVTDTSGNSYPANHLAVIDDTTGAAETGWAGSADNSVYALAVSGSTLYVGGKFDKVDGVAHRKLAALDLGTGNLLTAFTGTAKGTVLGLAATSTSVFASGQFNGVSDASGSYSRSYVAKFDGTTGAVDQNWSTTPNAVVRGLAVSDDASTLYLVGDFTTVGGFFGSSAYGAAVSTSDPASVQSSFRPHLGGPVFGVTYNSGNVFYAVAGINGACAEVTGTSGSQVWYRGTDGNANSITVLNGVAYCGGHFANISGLGRKHLAGISTAWPYSVTAFSTNINSALGIEAVTNDGTNLYAGGYFTKAGAQPHAHFAEFLNTP